MKIIYDSEKPTHERVQAFGVDGKPINCGCFWFQAETTNMETGKGRECLNIKRWGPIKERNETHAKIAAMGENKEPT